MRPKYMVYGYTDDDPESERPLERFATKAEAIAYAETNPMATCVEDDNDAVVWQCATWR